MLDLTLIGNMLFDNEGVKEKFRNLSIPFKTKFKPVYSIPEKAEELLFFENPIGIGYYKFCRFRPHWDENNEVWEYIYAWEQPEIVTITIPEGKDVILQNGIKLKIQKVELETYENIANNPCEFYITGLVEEDEEIEKEKFRIFTNEPVTEQNWQVLKWVDVESVFEI